MLLIAKAKFNKRRKKIKPDIVNLEILIILQPSLQLPYFFVSLRLSKDSLLIYLFKLNLFHQREPMEQIELSIGFTKNIYHLVHQLNHDDPKSVLVIDDDQDYCDYLSFILAYEGFVVSIAKDGLSALDILNSTDKIPDLLIFDLVMPRLSGLEFRKKQLEDQRISSIPVLFLSEYEILLWERSLLKSSRRISILNEVKSFFK
jgi:PleD family two-component response regulator